MFSTFSNIHYFALDNFTLPICTVWILRVVSSSLGSQKIVKKKTNDNKWPTQFFLIKKHDVDRQLETKLSVWRILFCPFFVYAGHTQVLQASMQIEPSLVGCTPVNIHRAIISPAYTQRFSERTKNLQTCQTTS